MIDPMSAFQDLDLTKLRHRRGNKWSRYPSDVLPAWVADMDYPLAPVITEALQQAVADGDLGYPGSRRPVAAAFAARAERLWGWELDPSLVILFPDVVISIEVLIEVFTKPGDGILILTPIYPPFLQVTDHSRRRLVESPLTADGCLDQAGLAEVFRRERPKLVLFCNPHNPTGHVFTDAELSVIAALAAEHDALIVSDEIHAELIQPGHRHHPIAALSPETAERTVTVTSASKPFNIAGLRCAQMICGSAVLHRAVTDHLAGDKTAVGTLGLVATLAAWTPEGDEWLAACVAQIGANMAQVAEWAAANDVGFRQPEATYLAWLDFNRTGIGPDPAAWFLEHAKVALSPGPDFGHLGAGFARLNTATSPAILTEILDRLTAALRSAHP